LRTWRWEKKGDAGADQVVLVEDIRVGVGAVVSRLTQLRHVGVRPRTGAAIVMCQWLCISCVVVVGLWSQEVPQKF
jgi:hypothetical protein